MLTNVILLLLLFESPIDSQALLRGGLQALQRGETQAARADLEKAADIDPKNALIWASLAEVYLRMHENQLASKAAGTAEKTGGDKPVISHALAMYYAEAGQFARAGELEELFAQSRQTDPVAFDRTARYFLEAGDEQRALVAAGKAAENSPEVAFKWAQLLLRKQEFTPAADLIQHGLKASPENAQLVLSLGVARYGQRRFEDAITQFLNVIRIDPAIPQPYEFLGRMLDQAGSRLSEITDLYEKHAADNPEEAKAQLLLAKALLTGDAKNARAEALLRRAVTLDSNDWEAHYELGVLLANNRRYQEAAQELSRATELNGKEATAHYHLARVYDRLGEPEKAAAERATHAGLINAGRQ